MFIPFASFAWRPLLEAAARGGGGGSGFRALRYVIRVTCA